MTHLYIEQNTGLTEEVNSAIISKLYELAISGDLDNTSDLKGRLHTTACKDIHYEYLTGSVNGTKRFPELYITADNLYISFVDSVAEQICESNWGTSDGVTNTQLQAVVNSDLTANGPFVQTNIVNFPEFSKFTGITKLNSNVFLQCTQLQSITLPSSCTELGTAVFYGDTALSQINLSNIESIEAQCFQNCSSLSGTINLPNLTTIKGGGVFSGCSSITKVTGLSNITSIPNSTFENCTSLTSVGIDWTKITSIGEKAFKGTSISGDIVLSSLTSIGGNYENGAFRGCTGLTSVDISGSTITSMDGTFRDCTNLASVTLPDTLNRIGNNTFKSTAITSIDLKNVTEISYTAFYDTKLTSIDLSNIVHVTGYNVFHSCTNLISVTFPNTPFDWFDNYGTNTSNKSGFLRNCTSLTSVDLTNAASLCEEMFHGDTALTTVTLSASNITTIPRQFCYLCSNLTSLGEKVKPTRINERAFEGCTKLNVNTYLDLSEVTYLGHFALKDTITSGSITLPECTEWGEGPFNGCYRITELHCPKLTTVNQWTSFQALRSNGVSDLEVIDIPLLTGYVPLCGDLINLTTVNAPSATGLKNNAFVNCTSLTNLTLDFSHITNIGAWAFANCTGLNGQLYDFGSSVTLIGAQAFQGTSISFVLRNNEVVSVQNYGNDPLGNSWTGYVYVPDNLVNDYKQAFAWNQHTSQIKGISELPNS